MKSMNGKKINVIGNELKIGDIAPNFTLIKNDLEFTSLNDFNNKYILINIVPSLDTSVCDFQTRNINEKLNSFSNITLLTVSNDLPFAQKRWCGNKGLNIITLSDYQTGQFGRDYGVFIEDFKLLARAILILNSNREIIYIDYLNEMTNHPNYDNLFNFLNSLN